MFEDVLTFGEAVPGAEYIFRPGGYVVIQNPQNEIAVVAAPQGIALPGGGQETGESAADAAKREAHEECGLRINLKEQIGVADELVYSNSEKKYYRKHCVFFRAEVVGRDGDGEADHQLIWMTPKVAKARLRHQSQVWAVAKATDLSL